MKARSLSRTRWAASLHRMASSMARTRPASAGIADREFPAALSRCSWPRLQAPRKRVTATSEVGSSWPASRCTQRTAALPSCRGDTAAPAVQPEGHGAGRGRQARQALVVAPGPEVTLLPAVGGNGVGGQVHGAVDQDAQLLHRGERRGQVAPGGGRGSVVMASSAQNAIRSGNHPNPGQATMPTRTR